MHDPSFMALALIVSEKNDLNAKTRHKSVRRKSTSRLKIERKVDLNSSRCLHDPSFMALALIVSEKNDLKAKTRHKSVNRKK